MRIIYRISDTGYNKVKPDYITNENCLANATKEFDDVIWSVIADNVSSDTNDMIQKYVTRDCILYTEKGNGAATFNLALDEALTYEDDETIYFIENDYLHKPGSQKTIQEAFELGADFISLYDHPDKYVDGVNPYVEEGGEITKVFLSKSCHWKLTNSTTMTFAAKVGTLKKYESILRKYTSTTHPDDFKMWVELRKQEASLITPLPGYATHGETAWLSPLNNWKKTSIWNKI
jgi:hypothetical protein|tara:strand:- start:2746 stop:3444 length:699 start_codon:yes stop_codon:yes gene_type:complete